MGLFGSKKQEEQTRTGAQRYPQDIFDVPQGATEEPSWQNLVRQMDETGPGFVGSSLDLKALLISMVEPVATDLQGHEIQTEYDSKYLEGTIRGIPFYQGLNQAMYRAGRLYESIGEYWQVPTNEGWVVATTPELMRADDRGIPTGNNNGKYRYVLLRSIATKKNMFRLSNGQMVYDKNSRPILNPEMALHIVGKPIRHNISASVFLGDPTSPIRRSLPILCLYSIMMACLQDDRDSMAQWTKLLYLGADDQAWQHVAELKKRGMPPAVADFIELGKKDNKSTKIYPIMNAQAPTLIDLASPIDSNLIPLFQYLEDAYNDAQNLPSRVLSDESSNHWGDYIQWDKLIKISIKPAAQRVLDDFTEDIWRPALVKVIEKNSSLPEDAQIPLKIIPSQVKLTANTQNIERSMGTIPEIMALWKSGLISAEHVLKSINVPADAKPDLPDDVSEEDLRTENSPTKLLEAQGDVREPRTAAISEASIQKIQGDAMADKLNRLELEAWAQMQGILDTRLSAMYDTLGRKIIRSLADTKTASAKKELEKLKLVDLKEVLFDVDRTVLASNGTDLQTLIKEEQEETQNDVYLAFLYLGDKRDAYLGGQVQPEEEKESMFKTAAIFAALTLSGFALSSLAKKGYMVDKTPKVPSYIIRDVLSAGGGASVTGTTLLRDRDGLIKKDKRSYIGGFATGPLVQDVLTAGTTWMKPKIVMWQWWHDHPKDPFDPHVALDGENYTFETRTAMLANVDSFPKTPIYYPGDHIGCLCQELIVLVPYEEYKRERQ